MDIWNFSGNVGRKRLIDLVGGCSVRLSKAAVTDAKRFGNLKRAVTDLSGE
jgi:3-deoxy-D-arabino-heptulosonate 7-phosphate (DAHP) synthase